MQQIEKERTLEYKSVDKYGNETKKLIHIETTQSSSPINLDFDDTSLPTTGVVGSKIDMPIVFYNGGFGKLDLKNLC